MLTTEGDELRRCRRPRSRVCSGTAARLPDGDGRAYTKRVLVVANRSRALAFETGEELSGVRMRINAELIGLICLKR